MKKPHVLDPANTPHYQIVMATILAMMTQEPELDSESPDGHLLNCLADAIKKYEDRYWPIPELNEVEKTDE